MKKVLPLILAVLFVASCSDATGSSDTGPSTTPISSKPVTGLALGVSLDTGSTLTIGEGELANKTLVVNYWAHW